MQLGTQGFSLIALIICGEHAPLLIRTGDIARYSSLCFIANYLANYLPERSTQQAKEQTRDLEQNKNKGTNSRF